MSPAEEMRAAAKKLRAEGGRIAEPLAVWLESEAEWADHFLANEHALATAIAINGGAS